MRVGVERPHASNDAKHPVRFLESELKLALRGRWLLFGEVRTTFSAARTSQVSTATRHETASEGRSCGRDQSGDSCADANAANDRSMELKHMVASIIELYSFIFSRTAVGGSINTQAPS